MKRTLLCLLLILFASIGARGQARPAEMVDRMVAVVNGRELITYTDLLWQLALQPDVPLESPRREDLRRALDILVDQRLIAQEAEKLPSVTPSAEEVTRETTRLIEFFPSPAEFYRRLERVGLGQDSTQLREIIEDRVRIRKFLDFRFRSFTVVTPREVEERYLKVYKPRRQSQGLIVPKLEEVYKEIEGELIEAKVESDTDEFLEESRTAAEITILDKSLEGGS